MLITKNADQITLHLSLAEYFPDFEMQMYLYFFARMIGVAIVCGNQFCKLGNIVLMI